MIPEDPNIGTSGHEGSPRHGCIFCQKIKKFPQQQFQNQKVSPLAFSQNVKVSPLVVFQKVKVSPLVDSGLPKKGKFPH